MHVEILGSCFAAAMALPRDGDLIELTAKIQAFISEGQTARVMKAIAQEIVVLPQGASRITVDLPVV